MRHRRPGGNSRMGDHRYYEAGERIDRTEKFMLIAPAFAEFRLFQNLFHHVLYVAIDRGATDQGRGAPNRGGREYDDGNASRDAQGLSRVLLDGGGDSVDTTIILTRASP